MSNFKHVRFEDGPYSLDTGELPNWMHDGEPHVEIECDTSGESVAVPVRLLREFLALYDEAQAAEKEQAAEKDGGA